MNKDIHSYSIHLSDRIHIATNQLQLEIQISSYRKNMYCTLLSLFQILIIVLTSHT